MKSQAARKSSADSSDADGPAGIARLLAEDDVGRLGLLLQEVARSYRVLIDEHLKPLGMTRGWLATLAVVSDGGGVTRICQELDIGRASAGYFLQILERKGLVEREENPADRRSLTVTATAAGRATLAAVAEVERELTRAIFLHLKVSQRRALRDGLTATKRSLARVRSGIGKPARWRPSP